MIQPIALPKQPKILVARTDRIGDLVLSLPVLASIRAAIPDATIGVLIREYTRPLVENRNDVDLIFSFDSNDAKIPTDRFYPLLSAIRAERFDAAILLFSVMSVTGLLWAARIPVRVGPATKLAQVFLTHRIQQRRSKGLRHEVDHNLDLLKPLGIAPVRRAEIPTPDVPTPTVATRHDNRPLIGLHPGHGGSSRNWSPDRYAELASMLVEDGSDLIITGAPHERELVEAVIRSTGCPDQRVRPFINEGGLGNLMALLGCLDAFCASSTGPLHIASALGVPVVGIYTPVHVCLPERWGPIGKNDIALRPDVPVCDRCIDEQCDEYDCMEQVTANQVRQALLARITGRTS